jgi:hypothetical protein
MYREDWNNPEKSGLMPDVARVGHPAQAKAGDRKAWRFMIIPRPIS